MANSELINGKASIPTSGAAGVVTVQTVNFVAPRFVPSGEVIQMAVLPAGCRLLDLSVMSSVGGLLLLGYYQGEVLKSDFIDGDVPKNLMYRVTKGLGGKALEHEDRIIGLKTSLAVGESVYLQMLYAF